MVLAAVLALTLAAGAYVVAQSDSLQGSFGGLGGETWTLSASSPSGTRSVSVSDEIFVFDVTAPSTRSVTIPAGTALNFTFSSSTLDTSYSTGEGSRVTLLTSDSAGVEVGHGYIETAEASGHTDVYASVALLVTTTLTAGETNTFTLVVDSADLMDEDTGVDDDLVVSMSVDRGISRSVNLTGNTLKY